MALRLAVLDVGVAVVLGTIGMYWMVEGWEGMVVGKATFCTSGVRARLGVCVSTVGGGGDVLEALVLGERGGRSGGDARSLDSSSRLSSSSSHTSGGPVLLDGACWGIS